MLSKKQSKSIRRDWGFRGNEFDLFLIKTNQIRSL